MGGLDAGYLWRWFNIGANIGYFQQKKAYQLIGEQNFQNYGNLYLGVKLGPTIALFKDHAIIRLNYEFGYLMGKPEQVDKDDKLSDVIIELKQVMVHSAQPEIILRWGQLGLGIFYKRSLFSDQNSISPDKDIAYIGFPKQIGVWGLRFIAFGAR